MPLCVQPMVHVVPKLTIAEMLQSEKCMSRMNVDTNFSNRGQDPGQCQIHIAFENAQFYGTF